MMKTVFVLSVAAIMFVLALFSYGFAEEKITITTYYPSPSGNFARLLVSGNVGIGTTSPVRKLHIYNTAESVEVLRVQNNNHSIGFGEDAAGIYYGGNIYIDGTKQLLIETSGGVSLGTYASSDVEAPANGLIVSGNVGIGTNNPVNALHVYRNYDSAGSTTGNAATIVIDGNTDSWLGWATNGTTNFVAGHDNGESNVNFWGNNGSWNLAMALTTAGSVGIGRAPATNRLEVEGNASKTAAGDWLANSDIRIKTDIQDIENALGIINKLHPVKFRYSEEYRAKHSLIGDNYYYNFIAQEFQEVFPDSVQDDGEGYLQIDTYNIKPYLVAAMQELSEQVKELRAENEAFKKRIEALDTKLNAGQ